MLNIKSFKAILPVSNLIEKIVVNLENLSMVSAKEKRSLYPESFIHLLVPKIENYYLRASKRELAFQKISENFNDFLDKNILIKDQKEAIYIYRQIKNYQSYIGIWTLSSIDDYISNRIKKHELTLPEREEGLKEYLQQTGIDANPVLITYPENKRIDVILDRVTLLKPDLDFDLDDIQHQIWKINLPNEIANLLQIFSEMPNAYIADGHHRAAAAAIHGIEKRKLNPNYQGNEDYNFFSSVYIASNQLKISSFHRFLKFETAPNETHFLAFLNQQFEIRLIEKRNLLPMQKHQIGLYLNGKSYQIDLKKESNGNIIHDLDVNLLQNSILSPYFKITNPREDKNIHFIGGEIDLDVQIEKIDRGIYDLAFFVFPVKDIDLIKIADIEETMPAKSTFIEPKFLAGLITHEIA